MVLKTEIEGVAFDAVADQALAAMKQCAEQLGITGVGMVAHYQAETNQGWSSKMRVVERIKIPPAQNSPGINILAVVYSKASEMADTLKDSGSGVRSPMTGEFGWQGGLIKKGKKGYLIAAFSGDSAENDVNVSKAGLAVLSKGF